MQTKSSANITHTWPIKVKLWMLVWNFFPLVYLSLLIWLTLIIPHYYVLPLVLIGIYFPPPLMCRMMLWIRPITGGSYTLDSPEFLTWWATAQMQMIFCRLPFLEELLRLIPGLYSFWLRLWGAKIGRFTFWAPGLRILDRSFLDIGDDVVTGAGVRLNAHVIEQKNGEPLLQLSTICIGHRCQIGGYSLLTAGTTINDGETLHAFSLLPPFSIWQGGRRTKIASNGS
jgi:hypothetical protein